MVNCQLIYVAEIPMVPHYH